VAADESRHLRVLIANERRDRLDLLAKVVVSLGHEVIAREVEVEEVGSVTARERPDVALVGLGLSSEHALELFAYIVDTDPDELQSAIEITLSRFTEYHNLEGAFGRRAVIDQAKGILMARHGLNADGAFAMLRDHSQRNGQKIGDVAEAIIDSHLLLLTPDAQAFNR
jgi:response regulator NasT